MKQGQAKNSGDDKTTAAYDVIRANCRSWWGPVISSCSAVHKQFLFF